MTPFHIYLIFLKLAFIVQFVLIITKKQDHHGIVFIISNMVFKISVGLFIMIYFLLHDIKEMYYYDKMIIGFAGTILIYDAFYIDMPKALAIYKINFSPYTIIRDILKI
jgi:hypothetical protein